MTSTSLAVESSTMKEEKKKMMKMMKKMMLGHVRFRREASKMESLPDELLIDILSRVPTLDLENLRCVCRRWRNIVNVKSPLFRTLHLSHSMSRPTENNVLLLKVFDNLRFVDLASRREIAIKTPHVPFFVQYDIIGSCDGLLCLGSKQRRDIIVMNPITHQHACLDMEFSGDVMWWGFGFDYVKRMYKVVVAVRDDLYAASELRICDLDGQWSSDWRYIEWDFNFSHKSPACFVNGRLHWTDYNNGSLNILSFDLGDEKFRLVPTPYCLRNRKIFDLFVLRGCLCILSSRPIITARLEIWVMKEYGVKESWVKEVDSEPPLLKRPSYFCESQNRRSRLTLKGLGSVRDGEVLLKYKRKKSEDEEAIIFFSYPTCDQFQVLELQKAPFIKGSVIHMASLNWI